jgi:hypothetical protein
VDEDPNKQSIYITALRSLASSRSSRQGKGLVVLVYGGDEEQHGRRRRRSVGGCHSILTVSMLRSRRLYVGAPSIDLHSSNYTRYMPVRCYGINVIKYINI